MPELHCDKFISGPCGVGKSTLADAYAKHLANTGARKQVYVIHGDDFHAGFVETDYKDSFWKDGLPSDFVEWEAILKFNWECIIDTAGKVLARDLDVVIDYVVEAAKRSDKVFLAVGCHSGYGAAQRIYVKRGYIPDGSGVWYQNKQLDQYAPCVNDDDLLLFLSKKLR